MGICESMEDVREDDKLRLHEFDNTREPLKTSVDWMSKLPENLPLTEVMRLF